MQIQSPNVLIIGEDPRQTELYTDLIQEVVESRIDVIRRLESSLDWIARSNYNLIVIDCSGEIHGLDLLAKAKQLSPATSVLLISEDATVEEAVAAIHMGADDYLKKPFNLEAFQLAVKRGLDRKIVFGENTGASHYLSLLSACQMISASLEQSKIFGIVQGYLSREIRSTHSAFYVLEEGNPQHAVEGDEAGIDSATREILDIAILATNPLSKMVENHEHFRFIERGKLTPGFFVFRFKCSGNQEYFFAALSPTKPTPIEAFEGRLGLLRAQIEVTGKNIDRYLGVENLAFVDDVTGLYNTRYLNQLLDREILQSQQTQKSFAILFIDADQFKKVNDNHGHIVGSKILNELGLLLRRCVRDKDTVFRYGGDEFVAVLSPCDMQTAHVVAERIRSAVEKNVFLEDELNLKCTVSIGVALFPDHADSKKAIIEAADHAMYSAKKSTRNSVHLAQVVVPLKAVPGGKAEGS